MHATALSQHVWVQHIAKIVATSIVHKPAHIRMKKQSKTWEESKTWGSPHWSNGAVMDSVPSDIGNDRTVWNKEELKVLIHLGPIELWATCYTLINVTCHQIHYSTQKFSRQLNAPKCPVPKGFPFFISTTSSSLCDIWSYLDTSPGSSKGQPKKTLSEWF